MRKFYSIALFSLLLWSCSIKSEDLARPFESSEDLLGKWEYFEYTYSDGSAEVKRKRVEGDEASIEFFSNSELESSGIFSCDQASYQIEGEVLRIDFACEAEQDEWQFRLSWEGENLVLMPLSPNRCIEGCSQIFRKLSPQTEN